MRKLFLVLLVGVVAFGCTKETIDPNDPGNQPPVDPLEIKREQNAFGINFSGTWCGPCGSNGIPAITSASTTHGTDKLHIIKVGFNDEFSVSDFNNQLAQSYYPSSSIGIPGFGAGAVFHQSSAAWRDNINLMMQTPDAQAKVGMAITKEIKGDSLIFNARMKTFENLPTGVYAWSVFVVEDGLVAPQASLTPNPYTHKFVYRGSAFVSGKSPVGVWGHTLNDAFVAAAYPANTVVNARFGFARNAAFSPAMDLSKCYAYVVLNKLNPSTFRPIEFINSARTK
jgi:hypothetical protein